MAESFNNSTPPVAQDSATNSVAEGSGDAQQQPCTSRQTVDGVEEKYQREGFSDNAMNWLNQMRTSTNAQWCDVKIECRHKKRISAHGCVITHWCTLGEDLRNSNEALRVDLDHAVVEPLINFCYTGILVMNTRNILGLLTAAETLKFDAEVQKTMMKFFLKHLRTIATYKDDVSSLSEEIIRRALTDTGRPATQPIWTILLFNWWLADEEARKNAYIEFMQLFKIEEINAHTDQSASPMFAFGVAAGSSNSQITAAAPLRSLQFPHDNKNNPNKFTHPAFAAPSFSLSSNAGLSTSEASLSQPLFGTARTSDFKLPDDGRKAAQKTRR